MLSIRERQSCYLREKAIAKSMTPKVHKLWGKGFVRGRLAKNCNEIYTGGTHLAEAWPIEFREEFFADFG
jgi:hypothetical protein